jgi:hypothetical protein
MATLKIYQVLPNGVFGGETEIDVVDVNTAPIPAGYTRSSPYPIPENHYAYMEGGWQYIEGDAPPYPSPDQIAAQNKATATSLLQQTDWTCTVDITNPEYSNPYLMNQNEFLAYRSTVRAIAVNPPTTQAVFPPMPDEVWSNT